jgi:DegV family protein with EDD domain
MANIRIITDASAELEPEVIARYQITVLPIEVSFGDKTIILGPGDDTTRLFQQMADTVAKPMAAAIPRKALRDAYGRLSRETSDILVIPASSSLSASFARAKSAASEFLGRCRITVIDSLTASWGLGLLVREAAKAAEQGTGLDEIVRLVRGIMPHIYLIFFVERLDYLNQGGRIDGAQAALGSILHIKPLLLVEDGDLVPLEKSRTRMMAIEKLADFVAEFASIEAVFTMASPLEGGARDLIGMLREQLDLAVPGLEAPVLVYDPILACHLGPDALGVLVYEGI